MTTIAAPTANKIARSLPSLMPILLAVILSKPGGNVPMAAARNPKKKPVIVSNV
jgi:hypothetical protein